MGGKPEEFRGTSRFRMVRLLGRGGMGAVFEVFDTERESSVALKTLRHPSPQFLWFLKREFRVLQGIHHPNLVRLGELIESDGQWFFTMELIDGFDFVSHSWGARRGALMARGKPRRVDANTETAVGRAHTLGFAAKETTAPDRAAMLDDDDDDDDEHRRRPPAFDQRTLRQAVLGVADGLLALHHAGVVHRDLKPSNIMITDEGRVVLLDFGLAHQTTNRMTSAETSIVGTPDYMSPEQVVGAAVTPASDWYSVGATLYESLTGHPPAVIRRRLRSQAQGQGQGLPAPSTLVEEVPEDLETVCLGLLHQDPEARLTGDQVRALLDDDHGSGKSWSPRPAPLYTERSASRFIGRTAELDTLRRSLARTRAGQPVITFIEGASGIGKSALVRRFLDEQANSSTVILAGRCYERESVPFNAFDSLIDDLSGWLKDLAPDERARLLPRQIGALAQIFPVLDQSDRADLPASARKAPVELRLEAFDALRVLLHRIAETRDVILFIDDLHWSDADSRALLSELLGHQQAPPLLVIGAYPTEHQDDASISAIHTLCEASGVAIDRLALEALSLEDTRALIESLCREVDPELLPFADQLSASAEGSPFFLEQLVRHLSMHREDSLPRSLRGADILAEMIRARFEDLPPTTATLLRTAAVIAKPIDRGALLRIVDLDKSVGSLAIDAAVDLRMMRSYQSGEVEVYHERLRAPVAASVGADEVRRIYERVIQLVDEESWDATRWLGMQFLKETAPERALAFARRAAEQAAQACAFERAAELFATAAELATGADRRQLTRRRADMLSYAGFARQAAEIYLGLVDAADDAADDAAGDARDLQRLAADNYLRGGHIAEGLVHLTAVASELGVTLRSSRLRTLGSLVRYRLRIALRGLSYDSVAEAACDPKDLARIDTLFAAATSLGLVDHLKGLQVQGEHLLAALAVGEDVRVCRALAAEASFLAAVGGRSSVKGEALASEVLAKAEELGDPYASAAAAVALGFVRFFRGEYGVAIETYEKALKRLEAVPDAWWERSQVRYWHHMALASTGNFNRLAQSIPAALAEAERRRDIHISSVFRGHPLVWHLLREDTPESARLELAKVIAPFPAGAKFQAHYVEMIGRVMVQLYEGKFAAARQSLDEGQPIIKALLLQRMALISGEVHKLYGWCALQAGDERLAKASIRRLDKLGLKIGRAFAASYRAALAHRDGDTGALRRNLLSALRYFEECGAAHDAAACRFRLGQALGGERGRELDEQAHGWFASQHVKNPQRMIAFLSPGYGSGAQEND